MFRVNRPNLFDVLFVFRVGIRREFEFRDERLPVGNVEMDFFEDFHGRFDGLRAIRQKFGHFLRGPEGIVSFDETDAIGIFQRPSVADARKQVLGFVVVFLRVVDVVRSHDGIPVFLRQFDESLVDLRLYSAVGVFQYFEVEIALSENGFVVFHAFADERIALSGDDVLGDFSGMVSREREKPFLVLFEHFEVDSRFSVIIPLQVRFRNELDEVLVSGKVFGERDELVDVVILVAVSAALAGNLEFHADDALDAFAFAGLVEFERSVHVARVREGYRRHAELLRAFGVISGFSEAGKKRIMRVDVKVDERHGFAG